MLLNLDYWRENDSEKHLLDFAKKEREVFFYDQDPLNLVFRGQWFALHPVWNKFNIIPWYNLPPRFDRWEDAFLFKKYPLIIHYAGPLKPWFNFPFVPYRGLYCSFLRKTPWKSVRYPNKLKLRDVLRMLFDVCMITPLGFVPRGFYKLRKRLYHRKNSHFPLDCRR
jgi:lipopolysaccharide biosynthesis glycosyltransferase